MQPNLKKPRHGPMKASCMHRRRCKICKRTHKKRCGLLFAEKIKKKQEQPKCRKPERVPFSLKDIKLGEFFKG